MRITVASPSYDLAALFAAAVVQHRAVADVRITSSTLDTGRYLTVVTLTLDSDALSARFADGPESATAEEGADAGTPTPAPSPTPTPTATEGATP